MEAGATHSLAQAHIRVWKVEHRMPKSILISSPLGSLPVTRILLLLPRPYGASSWEDKRPSCGPGKPTADWAAAPLCNLHEWQRGTARRTSPCSVQTKQLSRGHLPSRAEQGVHARKADRAGTGHMEKVRLVCSVASSGLSHHCSKRGPNPELM